MKEIFELIKNKLSSLGNLLKTLIGYVGWSGTYMLFWFLANIIYYFLTSEFVEVRLYAIIGIQLGYIFFLLFDLGKLRKKDN